MKRLLAVCLILGIADAAKADEQSTSPYATAGDFAKYAMKLREQALLKVEPQVFVPTSSRPTTQRFPWKMNIVTTVFWVGEQAGGNNPVPNFKSCLDRHSQRQSYLLRAMGRLRPLSHRPFSVRFSK